MPRKIAGESPYATYPEWFMRIAEAMHNKRPPVITADIGPRNKAVNFRQRFHLFRRQLIRDKVDYGEAASSYTLSLLHGDKGWSIVFTRDEVRVTIPEIDAIRTDLKHVSPALPPVGTGTEGHETPITEAEHRDIQEQGYSDAPQAQGPAEETDNFEEAVNKWLKG